MLIIVKRNNEIFVSVDGIFAYYDVTIFMVHWHWILFLFGICIGHPRLGFDGRWLTINDFILQQNTLSFVRLHYIYFLQGCLKLWSVRFSFRQLSVCLSFWKGRKLHVAWIWREIIAETWILKYCES